MDWQTIVAAIGSAAVAVPAAIYGAVRYIRRTEASDGAERFANEWHQKVIDRQDREAERLRAEIQTMRENASIMAKRVLEVELENKVKRQALQSAIDDIRLLKRDKLTPDDLHTDVYRGDL
jgi:hypothetical protein